MMVGGVVAVVDGERCAACLTCVRVCPYDVPVINIKGEAEIDLAKCHGCGSCVGRMSGDGHRADALQGVSAVGKGQA